MSTFPLVEVSDDPDQDGLKPPKSRRLAKRQIRLSTAYGIALFGMDAAVLMRSVEQYIRLDQALSPTLDVAI